MGKCRYFIKLNSKQPLIFFFYTTRDNVTPHILQNQISAVLSILHHQAYFNLRYFIPTGLNVKYEVLYVIIAIIFCITVEEVSRLGCMTCIHIQNALKLSADSVIMRTFPEYLPTRSTHKKCVDSGKGLQFWNCFNLKSVNEKRKLRDCQLFNSKLFINNKEKIMLLKQRNCW